MVIDNLLGFLPAPYTYGAIFSATKLTEPRLALSLVFYYVVFGTVLMFVAMILRYKDFRDKEVSEREIQLAFEENKVKMEEEKSKGKPARKEQSSNKDNAISIGIDANSVQPVELTKLKVPHASVKVEVYNIY